MELLHLQQLHVFFYGVSGSAGAVVGGTVGSGLGSTRAMMAHIGENIQAGH